jgi:adenine specific DNA methylase Mod
MKLTKEDIKKYGTEKELNVLKEKGGLLDNPAYKAGWEDGWRDGKKIGYEEGYAACKNK